MKFSKSLISILSLPLFCIAPVFAGHGIDAPDGVEAANYTELVEFEGAGLWQVLNDLDFWEIPLAPPGDYYAGIDPTSDSFRTDLHNLIDDHFVYPYSHSSLPGEPGHRIDTWDIVALADRHPLQPDQVLDIYLNGTFNVIRRGGNHLSGTLYYDREHSWPKSLGFKSSTSLRNPAYSDCHHLFAAHSSYNRSRSNLAYGDGDEEGAEGEGQPKDTLPNADFMIENEEENVNLKFGNVWRCWLGRRGDVARAMFYMAVRYDGEENDPNQDEADLKLTDDLSLIVKRNSAFETGEEAYMGIKNTLLEWHIEDPVDDLERRRNTVIYLFQGNRNPFVDYPEYVSLVFGEAIIDDEGEVEQTVEVVSVEESVLEEVSDTETIEVVDVKVEEEVTTVSEVESVSVESVGLLPWISEFHYDNASHDKDEFVEVSGPENFDLSGWKLIGYNGRDGLSYKTVELEDLIPSERNGLGAVVVDFKGLQNGMSSRGGEADGLALVDSSGGLVQFISYEGQFSAGGGPAADLPSENIGVYQESDTPAGSSLQCVRNFSNGSFEWISSEESSPGLLNSGQ